VTAVAKAVEEAVEEAVETVVEEAVETVAEEAVETVAETVVPVQTLQPHEPRWRPQAPPPSRKQAPEL
jgi:hypothetical protein